eukprot:scaffold51333_cov27-Tisochrysis_lutea.AAC.7
MRATELRSGVPVSPKVLRCESSGRAATSGVAMPSSSRTAHEERFEDMAASSASSVPMHSGSWHSSTITRRQMKYSIGTPRVSSSKRRARSAGSAMRVARARRDPHAVDDGLRVAAAGLAVLVASVEERWQLGASERSELLEVGVPARVKRVCQLALLVFAQPGEPLLGAPCFLGCLLGAS